MIVYKFWQKRVYDKKRFGSPLRYEVWEGWFLFGFIPLYIKKVSEK